MARKIINEAVQTKLIDTVHCVGRLQEEINDVALIMKAGKLTEARFKEHINKQDVEALKIRQSLDVVRFEMNKLKNL